MHQVLIFTNLLETPYNRQFPKTKEDIFSIKSSPDVLIFADSIYKATPEQYKKLLKDNVTKTCKKSSDLIEKSINMEAKHFAKKLELSDC